MGPSVFLCLLLLLRLSIFNLLWWRPDVIEARVCCVWKVVVQGTLLFRRMCKNGIADMNIFDQIMQKLGSRDTYINDRLFCTFDDDGSGRIDSSEFTLGLASLWDADVHTKLNAYFEVRGLSEDTFSRTNEWLHW